MRSRTTWRGGILAGLVAGLVVVPAAMADQTSNSQSPLYQNTGYSCAAGITDQGSGVAGNVTAHRNPDGTVTVNIEIRNGYPNATYYPNILCVRWFGAMTTNSEGNGAAHFVLDGATVPPQFSVSAEAGYNPNTGTFEGPIDSHTSSVLTATDS